MSIVTNPPPDDPTAALYVLAGAAPLLAYCAAHRHQGGTLTVVDDWRDLFATRCIVRQLLSPLLSRAQPDPCEWVIEWPHPTVDNSADR